MVDALHEIWRVLTGSGILVDLRPLPGRYPLELVSTGSVIQIGEVDATGVADDDDAADRAMRSTVSQGHFVARRKSQFGFDFYWDEVKEMESFIESSRRMQRVRPSYTDCEKAHVALRAEGYERVRIRCRRQTSLAVYEKGSVSIY